MPLMENGMLHVSILTMLAVTAERFNALCHPFKMRMACTVSTTMKTNVVIWIVAYTLTIPFSIMTAHEDARFYDGSPIKVCRTKVDSSWRYGYVLFIFVLFFVLPFIVMIFVYSKIISQLTSDSLKTLTRNDSSATLAIQMRKQVVLMLIFIIVLFFVSLFPIRVLTLWLVFTPSQDVAHVGLEAYLNLIAWARILMYVNSAGNPIIYITNSTKFKIAFNRLLRRYNGPVQSTSVSHNHFNRNKGNFMSQHRLLPASGSIRQARTDKTPCTLIMESKCLDSCKGRKLSCNS